MASRQDHGVPPARGYWRHRPCHNKCQTHGGDGPDDHRAHHPHPDGSVGCHWTDHDQRGWGVLNGGCEVQAQTSVPDSTVVTDTSKQDPFLIDPHGSLIWAATSPVAFDDYPWKIWVEIGGARITLDSEESEDNDGGSQINGGDVANVEAYAAERGIDISQLRGVYKVGGDAANTCDGFGFVKLIADPLETIIAKVAAGLAILLTIILLVVGFTGRRRPAVGANGGPDDGGAIDNGRAGDTDGDGDDGDDLEVGPIFEDGFESGDTSAWEDTSD